LLRGAAPIQAAIQQGFTETGVTIMRVVKALDAGPIILQAKSRIFEDETYGELQERLSELGALSLIETLALLSIGKAKETPQDDALATYAGKVTRESARIDWSHSALEISRLIRAYDPKPGAYTTTPKGDVKLFGPKVIDGLKATPGVVVDATGDITIACGVDALRVTGVQPSGKSRMTAHEWVRGRGAAAGDRFGV
jgi:methionyl-tRNA formyltransferase